MWRRLVPITLLVAPAAPLRRGIVWDVDGTLVESTKLAFDATNEVLVGAGLAAVNVDAKLVQRDGGPGGEEWAEDMVELSNGCACCTASSTFEETQGGWQTLIYSLAGL